MITRRRFLQTTAVSAAGLALPAAFHRAAAADPELAPDPKTASFFLIGDTHFCADEIETSAMNGVSQEINARLIDWLNKLPGAEIPETAGGGRLREPHGVIHAGDVIDNGDKGPAKYPLAETELKAFVGEWGLNGGDGRLRWPVREIHGNHDSPQGDGPVIAEIKARNQRRRGLTNISPNGLHYSWDWAGAHFVALGIVAGDAPEVTRRRRYAPLGSLPFLRDDLARNVGDSGRPVILVHHVDVARYSTPVADDVVLKHEWDYGDVHAFHEMLKPYRVAGTLYGHTHVRNLFRWDGTKNARAAAGIPSINTDNAAHFKGLTQAFLHLELDERELRVREFATTDAWATGAWTPQIWRFPLRA